VISAIVLSIVLHAQLQVVPWIGSTRGSGAASPNISIQPIVLIAADGVIVLPDGQVTILQ
jgi:hypothetical protein